MQHACCSGTAQLEGIEDAGHQHPLLRLAADAVLEEVLSVSSRNTELETGCSDGHDSCEARARRDETDPCLHWTEGRRRRLRERRVPGVFLQCFRLHVKYFMRTL